MRKSYIIAGLLLASIITSCTRENEVIVPSKPIGGTGGTTTVNVTPIYLNRDVDSCVVYIAYNSKTPQPFTAMYDDLDNAKNVNGRPTATFKGLKNGDYYFYGVAYHDSLKKTLVGGAAFSIVDTIKDASYSLLLDVR